MLKVDLHSHSFFSRCGVHSVIEMLQAGKRRGVQVLAVTDHGPALKGHIPSPFFDRLHNPVSGIKLLKGMESNLLDAEGTVDFPLHQLPFIDIVLVGLHENIGEFDDTARYCSSLVRACERSPWIDVVTHPNNVKFPMDLEALADGVKKTGVALELNNSKIAMEREPRESALQLLAACRKTRCPIVVNSDAHCVNEVGSDEAVRPLIAEAGFPEALIINRTVESALRFIEERRERKKG